ncbi:hypothetical protein K432DRAFT_386387 [Lepidopterella palustris CBS 459.81]|uniref:Secreted protein n=1 Tax=Lepidopterella palustris CBS 459.81 TaxID=1314670 RepID=A0A8E2E0H0_9PEZI|nr:hypothetical protein K432DRAFT_386387 [Lepidopterella palustris CBS 459.81]
MFLFVFSLWCNIPSYSCLISVDTHRGLFFTSPFSHAILNLTVFSSKKRAQAHTTTLGLSQRFIPPRTDIQGLSPSRRIGRFGLIGDIVSKTSGVNQGPELKV